MKRLESFPKPGAALLASVFFLASLATPAWSQTCPTGSNTGANTGVTVDTATSDTNNKRIHSANWAMQTFTVDGSGCKMLTAVTFSAMKGTANGSEVSDLTVELRNVAAGLPGTNVLFTTTVPKANISTLGYADVTVVLATPIQISGGSQYALVLYTSGGSAGKAYRFGVDDNNPYAGGQFCKSGDSGATWGCTFESDSVVDMKMSICVTDCAGGCVHSQGYWKNHSDVWPVSSLMLGSVTYNQTDLLNILNAPVVGNGLVSLAHQLIAAKLNLAAGAQEPIGITAAISTADALIGSLVIPPIGSAFVAPSSTSALTTTLDQYNNGTYVGGPPHCNEDNEEVSQNN